VHVGHSHISAMPVGLSGGGRNVGSQARRQTSRLPSAYDYQDPAHLRYRCNRGSCAHLFLQQRKKVGHVAFMTI
jgi:hypothetical protein